MPGYSGKHITATFATVAFSNIKGWAVSLVCGTADTTSAHASETGMTRVSGWKGGTASVTTEDTGDDQVLAGATINSLVLQRTPTSSQGGYSGGASCTGVSKNIDARGVQQRVYNFKFNGVVTPLT